MAKDNYANNSAAINSMQLGPSISNKKITIVVNDFSDGAGKIAQLLALEFAKSNSVSLMLLSKKTGPRYFLHDIEIVDIHNTINNAYISVIQKVYNLGLYFRRNEPDLVISFLDNNNTMVGISLIGTSIPFIASERSDPLLIEPKLHWKVLRRIAYRRADFVSVLFDAFKAFDNSRYFNKCIVTPNPVLVPEITKRDRVITDKEKIRFVSLGRLSLLKRFDLMIKIFSYINNAHPNTELHIFGNGPEKNNLCNLITLLNLEDKVRIRDSTQDVYKVLVESDIYLMTSSHEGFPNAFCEALSVGLPSVSFKCHDGLKELVEDGESGFLIEEGNFHSFVEKIELLISDKILYSRISRNSKRVVEKYTIEKFFLNWERHINTLV